MTMYMSFDMNRSNKSSSNAGSYLLRKGYPGISDEVYIHRVITGSLCYKDITNKGNRHDPSLAAQTPAARRNPLPTHKPHGASGLEGAPLGDVKDIYHGRKEEKKNNESNRKRVPMNPASALISWLGLLFMCFSKNKKDAGGYMEDFSFMQSLVGATAEL